MEIIKASGIPAKFNRVNIEKSVLRAGASKELAESVAKDVEKKAVKGMNTQEILDLTLDSLKDRPEIATRYDLKRAIMNLGPSGFPFEEYFSQVLKNYGYKTTTGNRVQGKVVSQEVDIVAMRKKFVYMIEAKYHNSPGIYTDTKVAMYTHARFLDVKFGSKNKFDEAWLVTNTKCTNNAVKYAGGVNLKIIAWRYPAKGNLQELIEKKGLYPITIIRSVSDQIKKQLFRAKIVLLKDLAKHELSELSKKTELDGNILEGILDEAKAVCGMK